jgi:predicted  nucleic acid-binding Zn-ribbon protein
MSYNERKFSDTKSLEFICEECGDAISATVELDNWGDLQIKVEPCENCIDEAKKEISEDKEDEINKLQDEIENLEREVTDLEDEINDLKALDEAIGSSL